VPTGIKPANETFGPDGLMRRQSGEMKMERVTIRDGRPLAKDLALDVHSFELAPHFTEVRDFFDEDEIRSVYYPEAEDLIRLRTGAGHIFIFDHTLRTGDDDEREMRRLREPARAVHNDYTAWSGPQRLRDLLADEAEALMRRRFAIIQVWRPINRPAVQTPLALADARSVPAADFIPAERRHPGRVGEIYQFKYNPEHRWYYFPKMAPDEAIVFKVYDSATDGRARWSAHSAFDDPRVPKDAPARESIEIRAFAFFSQANDA
jgi:hypothetical protein